MISNRICAAALATAFATICSAPSALANPFDGSWSIFARTTVGHCESLPFPLVISGGRIYGVGGAYGGYPARFGGRVSYHGVVHVHAAAGPRTAHGVGRLGPYQGFGSWAGRGPSGRCAGVWDAHRSWGFF
jgi:hypothetical protein